MKRASGAIRWHCSACLKATCRISTIARDGPRFTRSSPQSFARARATNGARSPKAEVCIAPVMSLAEAPTHPHLRARQTFVERDGVVQPAPAPRFSRTPGAIQSPPARPGEHTDAVLADWGSRPRNSRRCARRARSRDLNATCRRCRKRPQRVRARFCCSPEFPPGFLYPRAAARAFDLFLHVAIASAIEVATPCANRPNRASIFSKRRFRNGQLVRSE